MWKYGRKVIDALFKRRTERTPVRAELERRSEADSSRSDIRVFEVGLSAEQHGDYEQGTRNAAQEEEGARLIAIANARPRCYLRAPDTQHTLSQHSLSL